MRKFQPSPQQTAIFAFVGSGSGNGIVKAGAGCGKTTTMAHAIGFMDGDVFYGVYNTRNAPEMVAKCEEARTMRDGVKIMTFHSAGNYAWRRANPKVELVTNKVTRIFRERCDQDIKFAQVCGEYEAFVTRLVSFGKQFLMGVKRPDRADQLHNVKVWVKLAYHFGLDTSLPEDFEIETLIPGVIDVYVRSARMCKEVIDHDDMIFAPIFWNARLYKNDWVILDEAQDLNPARRELARRMLKPGGRLIAVGDEKQAIYGFTGAGGDSMRKIEEEFCCKPLPLNVTYRCGKSIVAYANVWMPDLVAHESAPDGVVRSVKGTDADGKASSWFMTEDAPRPSDAILCRLTKPLVDTAYAMLRAGIACKIEGRDVGKNLINLARRWKIKSLDVLEERLTKHTEAQVAKFMAKDEETKAEGARDMAETLRVFIQRTRTLGGTTVTELVTEIEKMFADSENEKLTNVTILSTIHKSKGREWDRVYWLQVPPSKRPLKDWEAEQEGNLKGVAATRAKSELLLIPVGA